MYKFNFYHSRPENFFANNDPRQTKGLIGWLRGDFGKDGREFWHTWTDKNEKLNTPAFKQDFDKIMGTLRERLLTDRTYMRSVAFNHPEAKIESEFTDSYGMFAETDGYEYDIRLIREDGNYDFYIFCYDKRMQEPQFLNARRFRDETGKLTESVNEIARKTLAEARNYYVADEAYEQNGKLYIFKQNEENSLFEGMDGERIFAVPERLGTFLPDVASEGVSFARIPGKQMLANLTLGDLIKSVKFEDVHLTHDEIDAEVTTITELYDGMFTEEGKKAWADVLNSRVTNIFIGAYGLQIECGNIDYAKLEDFSQMLAGNWSAEEYDKWIKLDEEQGQNLNM